MEARKPVPWGALVFLLGLATGLAMVLLVFGSQSLVDNRFDPYAFGAMGKSLARGDGFLPFGTLIRRRAPLYPLLIGALYFVFGEAPRVVQLLQCLLLAGTCLLAFDLGKRLFNLRTGIIAGVAVALHPMMLRYVADLHLETLFTFLVTLTIWLSVRFIERPRVVEGVLLGAAAGLTTLTKAVAMLYPGLLAVGIVLSWLRAQRRGEPREVPWKGLAALFVAMGLVILPWTIRNYRVTGHLVPVSTGFSDAFLRGLIFSRTEFATLQKPPYTDAENEVNAYFADLCSKAGTVCEREDWETDQILNREMKRRFFAEPGAMVRRFFVGLFTFWYELTTATNSAVAGGLALVAWALALVGCRKARSERRPVWPLLLPVLYLNLLLAALLALGRYSAPVLPALWVLSAHGVDAIWARRDARGT